MSMAPPDDTASRDDGPAAAGSDSVIEALQVEIALLRAENAALTGRLAEFGAAPRTEQQQ